MFASLRFQEVCDVTFFITFECVTAGDGAERVFEGRDGYCL
jgi:hypothetical protein